MVVSFMVYSDVRKRWIWMDAKGETLEYNREDTSLKVGPYYFQPVCCIEVK